MASKTDQAAANREAESQAVKTSDQAGPNANSQPPPQVTQAPQTAQAAPAQPQGADIATIVAQALIASQTARFAPVTATPDLDVAERPGGVYYERGQVVDAEGRVIEQVSPARKLEARNIFLPPGRRSVVAPLDEGEADEPDMSVDQLPKRGQEPQD